jgi:hypothetical protein
MDTGGNIGVSAATRDAGEYETPREFTDLYDESVRAGDYVIVRQWDSQGYLWSFPKQVTKVRFGREFDCVYVGEAGGFDKQEVIKVRAPQPARPTEAQMREVIYDLTGDRDNDEAEYWLEEMSDWLDEN